MKFDILINTDDKFLQHAMATLCSLYENNKDHEITVHVLHKALSEKALLYLKQLTSKYGNKIVFYAIDERPLIGVQFRKFRPLSMAAYYRLLMSSVLPRDLDRVLYIDCDMIIMRDISEIFDLELDGYALAATSDSLPYSEQHRLQLHMEVGERTFNSGVMLVNLKYWRENEVEEGLLEYAKRHRKEVYLHDQDVLNYYFKKKWFLLPPKWNRPVGHLRTGRKDGLYKDFDRIAYTKAPYIYHYASVDVKPWYNAPTPEKRLYLYYLKMSGYKEVCFEKKDIRTWLNLCMYTICYTIKKFIQRILLANKYTEKYGWRG